MTGIYVLGFDRIVLQPWLSALATIQLELQLELGLRLDSGQGPRR
jgi:hypothetical protein